MSFNLNDVNSDFHENSDINVTPFIDVILVLLIVFMVSAPLSTVDVKVELPKMKGEKQTQNEEKQIFISMKDNGLIFINEDEVLKEDIIFTLNKLSNNNREKIIYLRSDLSVNYGQIIDLMNILREDGYLKVGLVGLEK